MSKIDQLRSEIDALHQQILPLFLKRLELAEMVWIEKAKADLAAVDSVREKNIIHQFDTKIDEEQKRKAVQLLQTQLLEITKDYLSEVQKVPLNHDKK